ncbi:hypothetical protein BU17DRAFT_90017 [Hysterangium stoloniferum]|nr:hypothetical protein BU17DRAFT_90017 [Hysterangium stoloniferum]
MPYARPATMQSTATNGTTSLMLESRYSSVGPSTAGSSTQSEEREFPSSTTDTWRGNVSASFSQLSLQFQAASQAVATIPQASDHTLSALNDRLDSIEDGQRRLAREIEQLKQEFAALSQREVEPTTPTIPQANGSGSDLEAALKEQLDAFKLAQEQLPAKLQNALATKSLSPLRMPPMKNRKLPPNAPSTRGEFEHLTKERYEALMVAYDVAFSGDTNAKRETLRSFLGIPSLPLDGKK